MSESSVIDLGIFISTYQYLTFNVITIKVVFAACRSGYYGQHCNLPCPSGNFGKDCAGKCYPTCSDEKCDMVFGCSSNKKDIYISKQEGIVSSFFLEEKGGYIYLLNFKFMHL